MKGAELKPRIGLFGRRNYGKSSLINFLTGQQVSIVSDYAGTTTDPVRKTMELGGIGPVIWVDTAGIDDEGAVGALRVEKTFQVLPEVDLALILFSNNVFDEMEVGLVERCQLNKIPFLLVCTQTDRVAPNSALLCDLRQKYGEGSICMVNVYDEQLRLQLCEQIKRRLPASAYSHATLLGDVVGNGDRVVMVTPIDSSAPEGRMILPQVQVLRDILDNDASAFVCKETQLSQLLADLKEPPSLVITDSQVYGYVSSIVPESVPLTSFSVVLARAKGFFKEYKEGTPAISSLKDGDRVLIMESCTHNVTCEDIGRVKLPKLLSKFTGKNIECEVLAGQSPLQRPITDYALVIQCGGCVVSAQQLASRLSPAIRAHVPVSNYGLAIAYMNGIFERSMRIFN